MQADPQLPTPGTVLGAPSRRVSHCQGQRFGGTYLCAPGRGVRWALPGLAARKGFGADFPHFKRGGDGRFSCPPLRPVCGLNPHRCLPLQWCRGLQHRAGRRLWGRIPSPAETRLAFTAPALVPGGGTTDCAQGQLQAAVSRPPGAPPAPGLAARRPGRESFDSTFI